MGKEEWYRKKKAENHPYIRSHFIADLDKNWWSSVLLLPSSPILDFCNEFTLLNAFLLSFPSIHFKFIFLTKFETTKKYFKTQI